MSGPYKFKLNPRRFSPKRTICEVHRDIWRRAAKTNDPRIQELAQEAYDMGKRMATKLHAYKDDWDNDLW